RGSRAHGTTTVASCLTPDRSRRARHVPWTGAGGQFGSGPDPSQDLRDARPFSTSFPWPPRPAPCPYIHIHGPSSSAKMNRAEASRLRINVTVKERNQL